MSDARSRNNRELIREIHSMIDNMRERIAQQGESLKATQNVIQENARIMLIQQERIEALRKRQKEIDDVLISLDNDYKALESRMQKRNNVTENEKHALITPEEFIHEVKMHDFLIKRELFEEFIQDLKYYKKNTNLSKYGTREINNLIKKWEQRLKEGMK